MFYCYNQNNSGGTFDDGLLIKPYVLIEANSSEQADDIAESIGIYFHGVEEGRDCDCCGDRWFPAWENDGTEEPTIYGKSYVNYPSVVIYLSGHIAYGDQS
jgi:hypothetical protein